MWSSSMTKNYGQEWGNRRIAARREKETKVGSKEWRQSWVEGMKTGLGGRNEEKVGWKEWREKWVEAGRSEQKEEERGLLPFRLSTLVPQFSSFSKRAFTARRELFVTYGITLQFNLLTLFSIIFFIFIVVLIGHLGRCNKYVHTTIMFSPVCVTSPYYDMIWWYRYLHLDHPRLHYSFFKI